MASSAQFIPYVVDTYHDPGYVGGEHRLVVELTAQDATASGVAEVIKTGSGAVQAQDAATSATTRSCAAAARGARGRRRARAARTSGSGT